ncbi:MAG: hypothetical protein ABWW66_07915 [Archaeoglobaceae archaeon]
MIALLLALLVLPGGYVNVSGNAVVGDCMFFDEELQVVYVGLNCTPGTYKLLVDGEEVFVEVEGVNESYLAELGARYQFEALKLRKQLAEVLEQLEAANAAIENLSLQLQAKTVELEAEKVRNAMLSSEIQRLEQTVSALSSEIESKESELNRLAEQLNSLNEQLGIYRTVAFFVVALFVGSYAAIIFASRRV